jgi:hypothetical protein
MKKILLAGSVLLALCGQAHSRMDQLPKSYSGEWCADGVGTPNESWDTSYLRCDEPPMGLHFTIKPTRYARGGGDEQCKMTDVRRIKHWRDPYIHVYYDAYRVKARCYVPEYGHWNEVLIISNTDVDIAIKLVNSTFKKLPCEQDPRC